MYFTFVDNFAVILYNNDVKDFHNEGVKMDTSKIKLLLDAIDYKSFSKAADKYSYTPSAFSHIADTVEDEIGLTLLKRTNMGVELNDYGEALYPLLKDIVTAEEQFLNKVSDLKNGKEIKIATYSSIMKNILPKVIIDYKKTLGKPLNISVDIFDVYTKFRKRADIDIIIGENYLNDDWEFVPLFDDYYVVVFQKDEKIKKEYTKQELYDNVFISPNDSKARRFFDSNKFKEIISVNASDDSSIFNMIKAGMGITVLPKLTVMNEKDLIYSDLKPKIKRTIGVAYRKGTEKKENIKKFVNYLILSLTEGKK